MRNNKLLQHIVKMRKGHYCHALELSSDYDFQETIEQVVCEFEDSFTVDDIIDFFSTIEIYYVPEDELSPSENDEQEEKLYSFDFKKFITEIMY